MNTPIRAGFRSRYGADTQFSAATTVWSPPIPVLVPYCIRHPESLMTPRRIVIEGEDEQAAVVQDGGARRGVVMGLLRVTWNFVWHGRCEE